jgi:hypothetical protein
MLIAATTAGSSWSSPSARNACRSSSSIPESTLRPPSRFRRGIPDDMSEVGELVVSVDGRWMVRPPTHCGNGHPITPGHVLVGTAVCLCQGGHVSCRVNAASSSAARHWDQTAGCLTDPPPCAEGSQPCEAA